MNGDGLWVPGSGWGCRFGFGGGGRGTSRFEVEWQERIPLGAGSSAPPDFHGETEDEQSGETGGCEDGKGENVHGRED